MANVGPMEIVLLLGLALLLFGAKRLPEIGRSLGSGMREFKESVSGETPREARSELPPTTAAAPPAPAPDAAPVRAAAEDSSPAPSAERENQPSAAASG